MNQEYWDSMHVNYRKEVMSVFHQDFQHHVLDFIDKYANPKSKTALDIGCGSGYFTEYMASKFQHVEACDFSETGLHAARSRCTDYSNITFNNFDVTCDKSPYQPLDFVLCINLLLMPSMDERLRAWRTVTNQVSSGGILLLVVPSLESILMEKWYHLEDRLLDGESCEEAQAAAASAPSSLFDLQFGVHNLDGQRAKHYLKEELTALMESHEFDVKFIQKIDYKSKSWDWLVVAQRRDVLSESL